MTRFTAVAIVLGLLVGGTASADDNPNWFYPSLGIQVSDLEDGDAGALSGGGMFVIPRVAWWLPDVMGLNLAVPGSQESDPAPPQNVLGLEMWWTPLRSSVMDIGLGGGINFANFALEDTDTGGMYGLSFIFKLTDSPRFMLSIMDYTDFQDWDLEATGRFCALMDLPL